MLLMIMMQMRLMWRWYKWWWCCDDSDADAANDSPRDTRWSAPTSLERSFFGFGIRFRNWPDQIKPDLKHWKSISNFSILVYSGDPGEVARGEIVERFSPAGFLPHHNHLLFVSNPPQIFATTRNPRVCQHNNKWDQIWKFHKEIEICWCDKQIVHTLIFSWIVSSFGETYSTDNTFCFAFPFY